MPQYSLSNFLTCFTTFFLAIFVFFSNRKSKINRVFCLYSLSISEWSFFTALHALTTSESVSFFSAKIMHLGVPLIFVLFFHFCLVILDSYNRHKNKLFAAYFISFILIIVNFSSNLIVARVRPKLGYYYFMDGGFLYPFLILSFFIYTIMSLYFLLKGCLVSRGIKRNQLKYLFGGSLLGYVFGTSCFLPVYDIEIFPYPFGSYAISVYAVITAYAIVKYRLMDITVAITRTGIFVAVYTLVLGLPFAVVAWLEQWLMGVLGANWWIAPLGLMAGLATSGPFIFIYLNRKAENRLLKAQKRYQDTLKQAALGMTRIRDLRKLLDLIVHIITKTVRISYAAIYIRNPEANEYNLEVSRDKGRVGLAKLNPDNPLITWINQNRLPLVYEEIKRRLQDYRSDTYKHLEENMRQLSASVIVPSFLEDRFMGFIVLGDKVTGQIYTSEDLNVFQVLASQAALAIENAQFYEEAKKMQEQIAQAEKMATIGTMAGGLSHQINNRLNAISLIAEDTIDSVKIADFSQCNPEIKKLVEQVNYALERIRANVIQGGKIVKGLLKYSRKREEGFESLDLNVILDSALEMAQYKVKLSEIDIIRNFSDSLPKIKGNPTQIEEVFFNFIDNAYDAIVERHSLLKEEGYRGRITISAQPKDNTLEITVEDNGLGVKNTDKKNLFTPFFTTKVSSRRGTGLGLYVIKRIITEMHKGEINFESEYKVGTRFTVELPIVR